MVQPTQCPSWKAGEPVRGVVGSSPSLNLSCGRESASRRPSFLFFLDGVPMYRPRRLASRLALADDNKGSIMVGDDLGIYGSYVWRVELADNMPNRPYKFIRPGQSGGTAAELLPRERSLWRRLRPLLSLYANCSSLFCSAVQRAAPGIKRQSRICGRTWVQ